MTEAIGAVYAPSAGKREKNVGAAAELRSGEVSPTDRADRPHSFSTAVVSLSLARYGEWER